MKRFKITQRDYIKANRKASREEELERYGHPLNFRAVHLSKKIYNRKRDKAGSFEPAFFMSFCLP
ncbi:MAG: hypothetical protein RSB29_05425 [Alistipes sp.]